MSLLIAFQNLLLKRFISFLNEMNCSLHHLDFDYQEKYMYYVKGGLHRRIFVKINTIFKHMLYYQYSFVYTEKEFSKTNTFDLSFLLLSYSCQGELIQISLS